MIEEQALAWVIRTRDPEFADWEGFTLWLESDPAHAAAYDRLSLADDAVPALLPDAPAVPRPANDPGDRGWRPWRWIGGGAIAAVLLALVSITIFPRSDPYSITTAPGEQREIALADGTRIALNGDTHLRLDHHNPRFAALDRGEAVFTVTHDASDPFRVTVGQAVFEDAGTIFNITRAAGVTRIGVSEGEVIYNPRAEAISLPAGRALRSEDGAGKVVVSAVSPQAVASWRQGRLMYDNAPLSDIAGDIARSIGVPVRAAPAAAAMRFTGTVMVDRDAARFFSTAAPLLGVKAERTNGEWLLKEGDGAS